MPGDGASPSTWATGRLVFPRAVMESIDAHVRAEYPNEGCGYAVGPEREERVSAFEPLENLQDRYHERDPVQYPRTARTAYLVHPLQFERAVARGLGAGVPVKVIVHSHADHDAYFSAEDVAFAVVDGVPTRDCAYLVVSVREGEVRDRKLFALVPEGDSWTYAEAPLRIEEDEP